MRRGGLWLKGAQRGFMFWGMAFAMGVAIEIGLCKGKIGFMVLLCCFMRGMGFKEDWE